MNRREMLRRSGAGIGALALAQLLGAASPAAATGEPPLAPRTPHFPPKAKRFVHLFANGGPSQVDTFDPKPLLAKFHGKPIPREIIAAARDAQASGSPAHRWHMIASFLIPMASGLLIAPWMTMLSAGTGSAV